MALGTNVAESASHTRPSRTMPLAFLLAASLGSSCGDGNGRGRDAGSDGGKSEEGGQPCTQRGQTQTGCRCAQEGGGLGSRRCEADLTWSVCSCPRVRRETPCEPGSTIWCEPCPGETEWRERRCSDEGKASCPACGLIRHDAGARPDAALLDAS
jgi:hypothetical protein